MAEEGSPISNNELIFLVLKFLEEQQLTETAEVLREEHGYFTMTIFENMINDELWDKAYDYLFEFIPDPMQLDVSMLIILYAFNKLQHFATKNERDRSEIDPLLSELSDIPLSEEQIRKELQDLTRLASASTESIQIVKDELFNRLKKLIENNPCLQGSSDFPRLRDSSLQQLIGRRYLKNQAQAAISIQPGGTSSQGSEGHLSTRSSRFFRPPPARPPRPNKKPILTGKVKSRTTWMLTRIKNSSQIQLSKLPPNEITKENQKIVRLSYTNSGREILALLSNGYHLVLQKRAFVGKVELSRNKQQPALEIRRMINDMLNDNTTVDTSCFALSGDDSFLVSTSGGRISLYNPTKLEFIASFMPPPPAATSLAFPPRNNYMIAIGKDNFTIEIINPVATEVKWRLEGHTGMVTGLAFSKKLSSLVSSGEDAQIIVWSTKNWERRVTTSLEIPLARKHTAPQRIEVQYHPDGIHFLAVHQTQLAIYKAPSLVRIKQWSVDIFSPPVHRAAFSCDGQLIYSSFLDGTLRIFSNSLTNLELLCRIDANAYIPSLDRTPEVYLYHEIAAHPYDRDEFAVGTMDGEVYELKPLPSEGQWGDSSEILNYYKERTPSLLHLTGGNVPEVHEMGQGDNQAASRN